ncbi:glycosyltransferase family 2 protein [Ramlibacter alkalitolerans]|uniref:Glycosyltransferase family 2 protein n=1 Tax=Ramlibacter alkalitolerans TaxID=2039631 RepID=A0ABS1JI04_9BURK|nr:glycosyltransferase family 2 protein [Ramlibacter alkalitolerans]
MLPVRNGMPYLRDALLSLLGQTFGDFEVLVLDDGSDDGGPAMARTLGDGRIQVHEDARRIGLAARLNQGVRLARGELIARMDADDICLPRRFEVQSTYLSAHPEVDLVGCRAAVFRQAGEVLGLLPFAASHEALCARPWHTIPLPHPTWLGRREWFMRNPYRIPEVVRAEDQELLVRASVTSRYACVPEVLLAYRLAAPDLRKLLVARRSQLLAQVRLLALRREWSGVMLALACGALKSGRDVAAAAGRRSGYRVHPHHAQLDPATLRELALALEGRA